MKLPNTFNHKNIDIWKVIQSMIVGGLALVILSSVRFIWFPEGRDSHNQIKNIASSVIGAAATGLIVSGACFVIGGLTGFLFAIPKLLQNNSTTPENDSSSKSMILHNDNLVQISDWITKIIVGVGLTQLMEIPHALSKVGSRLGASFTFYETPSKFDENLAMVIILYWSVLGFVSTYLWTRLYFIRHLAQTGIDLSNLQKDIEQKDDELQALSTSMSREMSQFKETLFSNFQKNELDDDPHKGKFGSNPEANNRKLLATVTQTSFDKDLFNVVLIVESSNESNPVTGLVKFHLHPTFREQVQTVNAVDGKAKLSLIAWGAFTVGVECDGGKTKLELDLATEVPDAPYLFRSR